MNNEICLAEFCTEERTGGCSNETEVMVDGFRFLATRARLQPISIRRTSSSIRTALLSALSRQSVQQYHVVSASKQKSQSVNHQ